MAARAMWYVDGVPVGGAGGGGGSGTVVTDGVTILGVGSSGDKVRARTVAGGLALRTYAESVASAAQSAAQSYADSAASAAGVAANSYADGTAVATLASANAHADALDLLTVHRAGPETITGPKTFSATLTLAATIAMGGFAVTGAADPSAAQDLATKAYVDARAEGFDPKASARAASSTNLNLASMPAAVGGVTLASGESFLAMGQTTASQNGWYVFNGAAAAATRRSDANTSAKVTSGAFSFVSEGTFAGTNWALLTADPIVLGTTALSFTQSHGPGTYTSGTGLTLTGTQFAIDSTVATLTGVQILSSKTFTSPTINAATLAGVLAGTPTFSGDITFGAKIIGGTLGPTSGQQHTLPAVASDTVTLNSATQTLAFKTLTNPTINAATLSGILAGDHTISGIATFTAAPIVSIDNATTNDVTDVAAFVHTTSGTPAAGIAAGIALRAENASGIVATAARISGRLTTLTNGAENGALDLYVNVAGTMTRRAFLGSDGGLVMGTGIVALGVAGIGLPQNTPLYGGNAAGTGWNQMIMMQGGTQVQVGGPALISRVDGLVVNIWSYNNFTVSTVNGWMGLNMTQQTATWGHGDATATPYPYTNRGPNASGTNIAGATHTWQAPLGTGNASPGVFRISGGQAVASGVGQHTVVTLADFVDSDTDNDTALLVRVRKGGVETVERVTLVSGATVAASGRNFLSVS